MKWSRWGRILFRVLVLPVLVAVHILLAPWTTEKVAILRVEAQEWWAQRTSRRYLESLRGSPHYHLEQLVACATAFRDHLAKRNIALVVVLRPGSDSLLSSPRGPQTTFRDSGAMLLQAEAALQQAGVPTFNAFPALHETLCLHPELAVWGRDGRHLGPTVQSEFCRILGSSLTERQTHREGRDVLFAGDCYAFLFGNLFQTGKDLPHVHVLWRNAGAHLMPAEIAKLPEQELDGIRQVMWFVTEEMGAEGFQKIPPFPSAEALKTEVNEGERATRVKVTKSTRVPPGLDKNSPYADALLEQELCTPDGESFLGLIEVMKNHQLDASLPWVVGESLVLHILPWDSALKTTPELKHEQILEDEPNFTLPRYLITRWVHAP